MNILVVGPGAREHAIVWKLLHSPRVRDVYVAPGNAGTGLIARNLPLQPDDFQGLRRAVTEHAIDLVVIGPEAPLAEGMADSFRAIHVPVFGPSRAAARIESSKAFAKELMQQQGIPCAESATFTDLEAAQDYVYRRGAPIVIKADGLAAGKGVIICQSFAEAREALDAVMRRRTFGAAGNRVVIEEYLEGREVSLLAFCDGDHVAPMVPATDYKRVNDGDVGLNTGGMGAFSPPPFFTDAMMDETRKRVLEPAVQALKAAGTPFVGVLYAGLMLTEQGIKVLEFNCRFGDPETQVVLPRLRTDLVDVLEACVYGRLDTMELQWDPRACLGAVVASGGYPERYDTGFPITGLDTLEDGVMVFHGGTASRALPPQATGIRRLWSTEPARASVDQMLSGDIVTAGGRVLTVVALGDSVESARRTVYRNIERIVFQGAHFRRDIGEIKPVPASSRGVAKEAPSLPPDR